MGNAQARFLLRHIGRLLSARDTPALSDEQLLERFVGQRDEAAFAALVERHGRLVFGLCRRILRSEHDAEDAFQATFLVLARRASAIRRRGALGCWLHHVAYHAAVRLQTQRARRRAHELAATEQRVPGPLDDLTVRELRRLLDEELLRLPEKYRAPLVLCYLEGLTRDEAAQQLRCSLGTFKSRLERGRELLRQRLVRRGLGPAAVLLTSAWPLAAAGMPAPLANATVRASLLFASGQPAVSVVSSRALTLALGMLKTMSATKLTLRLVLAFTFSLAGIGLGAVFLQPSPDQSPESPPVAAGQDANEPKRQRDGQQPSAEPGEPLPAGARARLGDARLRHGMFPASLFFLPDGKTLAVAGHGGTASCWDATTGRRLRLYEAARDGACACALSPDGRAVAWGFDDGEVRVRDAATGGEQVLRGHRGKVYDLAFTGDGKMLLSSAADRTARAWDVATGQERQKIEDLPAGWSRLAVSPQGKAVALASQDGRAGLWNLATGARIGEWGGAREAVRELAFSPDGKLLAFDAFMPKLGTWVGLRDAATGRELGPLGVHPGSLYGLAFSPDGKTLAVATVSGTVRQFHVATGAEEPPLPCHFDRALAVAYSPDGKRLATADSWAIRVWDRATGREVTHTGGHRGEIQSVAVFPDGKLVATASEDHTARVWDRASGRELVLFAGHERPVYAIQVSSDGKALATAGYDGTARVWDAVGGEERLCLRGRAPTAPIALSPDGTSLASADQKGRGCLWDCRTGEKRALAPEGDADARALAFAPDGRALAWGTGRGLIELREAATGGLRLRFPAHPAGVTALAFCAGGRLLASGGYRYEPPGGPAVFEARLWDAGTGREVRSFPDGSTFLAVSPGGELLATGGRGNEVVLWATGSGKEVGWLRGHQAVATCGAFTAGGRVFISGSYDTTALVWDVSDAIRRARPPAVIAAEQRRRLRAEEVDGLWADLAGADAGKAYRAISTLVAAGDEAVPDLKDRLRPAAPADGERLARLVADLDSDRFAVRNQAMQELEALGELVVPALHRVLDTPLSLEARRRAEQVLEKLERAPLAGEALQALRAVEVLERVGTTSARKGLERLADGAPEARLTREAQAALARLARQPVLEP
jgi:RNA polymerase sigma factor (sigma-70 family)